MATQRLGIIVHGVKTGVMFMAWLNGHQKHFTMVGGQQSARSLPHLAELVRLADAANLLEQPEMAVRRMNALLAVHGIDRGMMAMASSTSRASGAG